MSNKDLFQICQEGDLDSFHQLFELEPTTDINAKDVHGMSALAYSARNGQVELVRELLQRGAEKHEVMEQGYGLNNAEIAGLLHGGESHDQNPQHNGMNEGEGLVPVQMEDGTITYMNPAADFGQGYGMPPPQFGGPQFPHHFFPMEGMHAGAPIFQPGNGMGSGRRNHSRKESGVNLPPPDVARMIPCKYFPNCKYGDKCVFAHPIPMGAVPPMPPQGHPLSPSMSHPPPMQPMFYGQMPPGYPYPPYGANPQQFLPPGTPMGHPSHMPQFNGVPQNFGGQPQGGEPQPQDSFTQSAPVEGENIVAGEQGEQSNSPAEAQNAEAPTEAPSMAGILNSDETANADPSSSTAGEATEDPSTSANGKPVHRRQSFNSFLHHHAVPFQPQSQLATEMNGLTMDGTANGFVPRSAMQGAGKVRRMNGFAGSVNGNYNGKRGNHSGDRPPCTFFQSGRCKYGDECRFPHILADGTDARPLHAQQRMVYPTQYANGTVSEASPSAGASKEQASRSAAAEGAASSVGNANAPASAPTGPQADKKATQQQPPSQTQQSQQQKSTHSRQQSQSSGSNQNNSNAKDNKPATQSNGVVRSNPSKTSVQANGLQNKNNNNNNNNASGSRSNKKHNNNNQQNQKPAQPSQRVPTVNDFPALASPNPSGTSPSPSAAKAVNGSAEAAFNDANAVASSPSASSTPAAPARVNFSAILSAPAPVKPVKAEPLVNGDAESSSSGADAPAVNGKVETGEESKPAPVQAPKTHASVAAAAAAANAATNGVPTGTTVKAQSQNAQPKTNNGQANEGGVSKKQQQKQANGKSGNSQKVNGTSAPSAAAKTNGTPSPAPVADDDFQLVNRSRHSSNKRPTQSNGNHSNGHANANGKTGGDTYTPQAKAVAA
ncbi:uncharacterized protein FA14DRAFT_159212 [Meira miltonrushii]|uniref:C3H1-type domain-containing protein n=1 Tax=Meira miltonrushii TaxID=1280837 RepID=A0A316VMZ0_9BASI|nr:uncharacterized protein FA14DRAFT_159212 [Meira miltonrushii]PWN36925.1 hypothetical protein FA14DRAFT_159212 [Meira miltonrushii]